jgi:flagellar hook assembly protein FlgD
VNDELIPASSPGSFEDTTVWPETTFWYELRVLLPGGTEDVVALHLVSATTGGRLAAVLYAASPNPFVRETSVMFDVPSHAGRVSLSVYSVTGQLVKELVDGPVERGRHLAHWDGRDSRGVRAASGVYFLKLTVGVMVRTEKVLLVR